jgi:transcriptional regulator with XRE-family HTH domain
MKMKLEETRRKAKMRKRLEKIRKRRGLTQEDVAKHLGITVKKYAEYEKDPGKIKINMMAQLADLLGVTLDYICCRPLWFRLKWYLMMHNPLSKRHYRLLYGFPVKRLRFCCKAVRAKAIGIEDCNLVVINIYQFVFGFLVDLLKRRKRICLRFYDDRVAQSYSKAA